MCLNFQLIFLAGKTFCAHSRTVVDIFVAYSGACSTMFPTQSLYLTEHESLALQLSWRPGMSIVPLISVIKDGDF